MNVLKYFLLNFFKLSKSIDGKCKFCEAFSSNRVLSNHWLTVKNFTSSVEISENLDTELSKKALEIFLAAYEANVCVKTITYPNVADTLRTLKDKGYRLAIITNKPERFIAPILSGLGLNGLFELIIGGDTLPKRKPDPLQLNYACEQLAVTADDCIMIGDSKNDILAAKAANMQSVGLTYGYNYGASIAVYQPELVLTDFSDLLKAV